MLGFGMFDMMVSILFPVMSLFIFGMVIATFFRNFKKEKENDRAPVLSVDATVVTKRTHVWGDHARTNYFVTFQVESGDRMELEIDRDKFGYLVENDRGKLTFQGKRFLEFQRT